MKKLDWYILTPLLIGALWLSFLPNKKYDYHEVSPKELLYQINLEGKYFSTDDVAKAIISKDPSFILIDVRTFEEYSKFSLPGALNIPFDSLFNENYVAYLNQDIYSVVLFSNGSSLADQAWVLLHRIGYKGTFVMKGGLNEWIETIIQPQKPDEKAGQFEWEQYESRKIASQFFGGGTNLPSDENNSSAPPVPVVKRKKTEGNVGGCE